MRKLAIYLSAGCGLLALVYSTGSAQQDKNQINRAKTVALTNMKQLAIGVLLYVSDYDDILPLVQDTDTIFAVTMPYLKNKQLFKSLNPSGGRINFNLNLGGVNIQKIPNPSMMPLYFDSKPWPDGLHLVGYADAHIAFANPARWEKDHKQLQLKLKRTVKGNALRKQKP